MFILSRRICVLKCRGVCVYFVLFVCIHDMFKTKQLSPLWGQNLCLVLIKSMVMVFRNLNQQCNIRTFPPLPSSSIEASSWEALLPIFTCIHTYQFSVVRSVRFLLHTKDFSSPKRFFACCLLEEWHILKWRIKCSFVFIKLYQL